MTDRPLVITDDDESLDDLLRVAAAAGVEVTHLRDIGGRRAGGRDPGGSAGGRDPGGRDAGGRDAGGRDAGGRNAAARRQWRAAPLVIINAAQIEAAVDAELPRRPGVVAVAFSAPSARWWELCVRLGVERTLIAGIDDEQLVAILADSAGGGSGDGRCIAVLGASGGAGASVFATAMACLAGSEGRDVLLADCDPWGAGLDVLLGLETHLGVRWSDLAVPSGRMQIDALQRAAPRLATGAGGVSVLCYGRGGGSEIDVAVIDVVLDAGRRSGVLTVADLPRQQTPGADRVLERADLVVLLTQADVRGCWSAERISHRVRALGAPAGVVVRGPSPGGIGATELAEVLQLPLLAQMRPNRSVALEWEFGFAPTLRRGPLLRAARKVLAAVSTAPRAAP